MNKIIFGILSVCLMTACCSQQTGERWSTERAQEWGKKQGWRSGCNYIPNNAINQIEMWSNETFDIETIDQELAKAEELGFNTMRVFLSSVVWNNEHETFKANIDKFLSVCQKHGIKPFFVFFDDCWDPASSYGKQREPQLGIHNSGWVRDPADALRLDTVAMFSNLKAYVQDVMTTFKDDERILMWDLYNEPGNGYNAKYMNRDTLYMGASLPLLKNVFKWAREVNPSQPVTSGIWREDATTREFNIYQLSHSDVISYHNYRKVNDHRKIAEVLLGFERPVICTEYMARTKNSTFQEVLPMLREANVWAVNWGFVKGKTNTIYQWDDLSHLDGEEPEVWFHDIIRPDGTVYSEEEIETIKNVNLNWGK